MGNRKIRGIEFYLQILDLQRENTSLLFAKYKQT